MIAKETEEEARRRADLERIRIIEAERAKELELKAERRKKKEAKRKAEEEARLRKEAEEAARKAEEDANQNINIPSLLGSPNVRAGSNKQVENLLRQSLNSQLMGQDYDQRDRSMLSSMRKLFEEARANDIDELNSSKIFPDEHKYFDGTVNKDEVAYQLLNAEQFTLTRSEVGSVILLMANISRDDGGKVDVDELHFSYVSYLKYYEVIEQRVVDILEKVKICVSKKIDSIEQLLMLTADLESKATDSKVPLLELRMLFEDQHGITMRDALYD